MHRLYSGPTSVRWKSERTAFWFTLLWSFPAAAIVGYFLHESVGISQVALFVVGAMIYVTIARGRLIGSSIRIHDSQYPELFAIVKRCAAALEVSMPMVFVRDDEKVPIVALGFGEPYSLIISSRWLEVFREDELAFVIGRELGHIAAGHTRFLSLLSVNGNENPIVALIFGAWLRRCDLTCDRVGLLACGSIDAAVRAIAMSAFHTFGRSINYDEFAEQGREIASDQVLRLGEWLGSEPYATKRIAELRTFLASGLYEVNEAWFLREQAQEPPALPLGTLARVTRGDCAGFWRRLAAASIDSVVVLAIIGALVGGNDHVSTIPNSADLLNQTGTTAVDRSTTNAGRKSNRTSTDTSDSTTVGILTFSDSGVSIKRNGARRDLSWQNFLQLVTALEFPIWFPVYIALLVAVVGQTFGMMIVGVRVVTLDFRRPSMLQSIGRGVLILLFWWLVMGWSLLRGRVLLHDKFTRTRVITVERALARASSANASAAPA